METSALNNNNVEKAFTELIKGLLWILEILRKKGNKKLNKNIEKKIFKGEKI